MATIDKVVQDQGSKRKKARQNAHGNQELIRYGMGRAAGYHYQKSKVDA